MWAQWFHIPPREGWVPVAQAPTPTPHPHPRPMQETAHQYLQLPENWSKNWEHGVAGFRELWASAGESLHKRTSEASAPALGLLLSSLPRQSGNRSSVGAACNPTWGRGHRNLVAQAFKKRLSVMKHHIVGTSPGCARELSLHRWLAV